VAAAAGEFVAATAVSSTRHEALPVLETATTDAAMRAGSTFPPDAAQRVAPPAERPGRTSRGRRSSVTLTTPESPSSSSTKGLTLTRSHRDDHLSEPSNGARA
jgi:hypothetical protein